MAATRSSALTEEPILLTGIKTGIATLTLNRPESV